ncbi:dipicolinate synthase subunit B [Desulfosporosinus sp. BICA1-9]|uniref:dipicolinate synthase subunit B n=1 Tax=Desulfosporosinus sp. BICA1-9 TaxID=1531958 RepID=UPI00054C0ED2|nr:dipicolinate synthase subunit B [Desulfosporosinus sp. BICA1-9]KJS47312.1 MAG: dipicolinate synthase subunit B [Peptococcaceae bacterium BRH_c23]KJS86545.1 MAG: dipicolinate synthase subunit B [Desulfosporosinus sp. BICA1-9]HBW36925.1 dipicolinate synthase subunit B [Desulfosporosinus sp.]
MKFEGLKIGFAITGSHCTIHEIIQVMKRLMAEGAELTPIISYSVDNVDTRFGKAEEWKQQFREITHKELIHTIPEAEPIGPTKMFDCVVIAPCTGNTLAKLANGIIDTPVLMAAKSHLRNQRPVVLAISTNDGLGLNARNIGTLLITKNVYLVPFGQDNPVVKANSLVAHMNRVPETILMACEGKQIQPVLVDYRV